MKNSEILKAAWALIDAPEKWCQGAFRTWRDWDMRDIRYCSLGAVRKALAIERESDYYEIPEADRAMRNAWNTLNGSCPGFPDIVYFNDRNSWEGVRDVWMRAIEFAENEEIAAEMRGLSADAPPEPEPVPEPEPEPALT